MTRPPSGSPLPPDAGDDGHDEDTAALERELGRFFTAPTPASLRSRVLAESNRYRREQRPPPGLDADHSAETTTPANRQEAPMRTAPPQPVLAFPGRPSTRSARTARSRRQDEMPSPRTLRRVGRDSLGLVASLALVVLVALSAIAVYDGSPDGDEPTTFAGAGVSTPTATAEGETADATAADPVYGTTDDGTEYVRASYGDCTNVRPITFDQAMDTIVGENYPFAGSPPPVEIATYQANANSTAQWAFTTLPAGRPVDPDIVSAVVETYGMYRGCEDTALRQASTMTPEGFARNVYLTPSHYLIDDVQPDGGRLTALWFDGQGGQINDPDHFGKLTNAFLYDFRMLPSGEVIAFLSGNQSAPDADVLPAFYENAGYVLFAERDGRWLIDEQF